MRLEHVTYNGFKIDGSSSVTGKILGKTMSAKDFHGEYHSARQEGPKKIQGKGGLHGELSAVQAQGITSPSAPSVPQTLDCPPQCFA